MGRPHHSRRNSGRRRRHHGRASAYLEHVLVLEAMERHCRVPATINLRGCPTEDSARRSIADAVLSREAIGAHRLRIVHGRPERAMWRIAWEESVAICIRTLHPRWVYVERVEGESRMVALIWGF